MDFPIRSSRTSVETREREPGSRDDRRGDEVCFAATHVFHPRPPACHRSRGRQGQALRVAAKSAAILDRHSTRWRSRTAVGAEEWLRWGQTKKWFRKQVSCQNFVITIREGRHQFSWQKKKEHSRIFPSDTVVVLTKRLILRGGHRDDRLRPSHRGHRGATGASPMALKGRGPYVEGRPIAKKYLESHPPSCSSLPKDCSSVPKGVFGSRLLAP